MAALIELDGGAPGSSRVAGWDVGEPEPVLETGEHQLLPPLGVVRVVGSRPDPADVVGNVVEVAVAVDAGGSVVPDGGSGRGGRSVADPGGEPAGWLCGELAGGAVEGGGEGALVAVGVAGLEVVRPQGGVPREGAVSRSAWSRSNAFRASGERSTGVGRSMATRCCQGSVLVAVRPWVLSNRTVQVAVVSSIAMTWPTLSRSTARTRRPMSRRRRVSTARSISIRSGAGLGRPMVVSMCRALRASAQSSAALCRAQSSMIVEPVEELGVRVLVGLGGQWDAAGVAFVEAGGLGGGGVEAAATPGASLSSCLCKRPGRVG